MSEKSESNVRITLLYLQKHDLIKSVGDGNCALTDISLSTEGGRWQSGG